MGAERRIQKGDVLRYSWGYDQTNVDAFEVVRTSEKSVWLQRIEVQGVPGSDGFMSRSVVPVRGTGKGPVIRKRRQNYSDEETVSFDYGIGRIWDEGKPAYESWYA
jgi:hypothetical protein